MAQALASLTAASEVAQIPVWAQAQARLFTAAVHAGVQHRIAAGLAADLQQLESLSQEYAKSSAAVGRSRFWKWFVQLLLGLAFLAVVTTSGWLLLRGCRRRQQVIADTCPMCLGVGKFQVAGNPGSSRRGSVSTVRCKNVVSANRNEDCRFEFLSVYRDMPKLCFPTLGHSFSGKTHWLAMLYRELNRGNYHANVQFEKVKSTSSEEFDRTVNDILNAKIGTRATQTAHLPFPLVFNFCDDDRFGRSNVLVNIFDYSGEVTRSFTLDHPHRRRAWTVMDTCSSWTPRPRPKRKRWNSSTSVKTCVRFAACVPGRRYAARWRCVSPRSTC